MNLKVGLGQINPTVGNFQGNTEKITEFIRQAEDGGCDLVVFPELAVCGYPVWDLAKKKNFLDRSLKAVEDITKATEGLHVTAVVGFIDQAKDPKHRNYNSLAVIRDGKVIFRQAKTLLPTYDVFLEEIFFAPGKSRSLFSIGDLTCGALICEDIWDDEYETKPAQDLKRQGAQAIVNIAASPYASKGVEKRRQILQTKAKTLGLWIFYVNQVCGQDDLIFDGRSVILDPNGNVTYEAPAFEEGLFQVSVDLKSKKKKQSLARKGKTTEKEIYSALRLGLADYLRKNKFQKVVLGLSGGIDSALVATLAADALGSESVIGVALPGPFSSEGSLKDAERLAKHLSIELRVKSINEQYAQFIEETVEEKNKRTANSTEKKKISLAMENLQARLRGLQLMYISNDEGALLLTTGNKSELAMGYGTLYGDMCGGLSVIGDVYKTEVFNLARYRNTVSPVIPESILTKAPSAELRPNQKDEDSLPPYERLDAVLEHYIEKNETLDEIVKQLKPKGISERTIKGVLNAVDHNEYKRRQLPPALRITEKAWFGRRMPITNGFDG